MSNWDELEMSADETELEMSTLYRENVTNKVRPILIGIFIV